MRRKETDAVECLQCVGLSFLQKEGQKPDATVKEIYGDVQKETGSLKGTYFVNNYAKSTKKIHGV